MSEPRNIGLRMRDLPPADLRDALETLVVARFRQVLLMGDEEELPLDVAFFDLGLTSLNLGRLRKELEEALDVGIDATLLFNKPTIDELVTHLGERLLAAAPKR
ncbi:acyl carrier protein [Streptomyces sp. NPDC002589]|uniref:acyl carrier protein n=1 Tax=Streptomyces sp. NPDC002589 TaxID=3154420 RepID=UPI00331D962A